MNDLTKTPARKMAELTSGHFPTLVTDEAFLGLCKAYERTGNKFLLVLGNQLIDAENSYAANTLRMRQACTDVPASQQGAAPREAEGQA